MPEDENKTPDWLAVARSQVSAESWAAIVAKQVEKAVAGDQKAVDFLASFCLPQPKDRTSGSDQRVKEIRLVLIGSECDPDA